MGVFDRLRVSGLGFTYGLGVSTHAPNVRLNCARAGSQQPLPSSSA